MENLKQDLISVESVLYRENGKSFAGRSYAVTAPQSFFEALKGEFSEGEGEEEVCREADEVNIRYDGKVFTFKRVQ